MLERVLTHFKNNDPKIYKIMEAVDFDNWFDPQNSNSQSKDYFYALSREIVGQQLSGKAAESIFKKFIDNCNGKELTPELILEKEDQALRNSGISWAKVKYLKDLAVKVKNHRLDLENTHKMGDEQVIAHLTQVKGIGPWTAEMFLIFTLNRENVFSLSDLGLRKGIEKVYKLKEPSENQILSIIKKWEPYKTYGSISLWSSLEN